MKRFTEQFHKKAQSVTLKKVEQTDLRERIVSYMEYHPLPAELKAGASKRQQTATVPALATEAYTTVRVPFAQLCKFGGVFAAVVLLIMPFVAERAVPGDTLYAVKVNFNEEVRSTLTWDPYEKVEWETVRLNRRIAEAKLLQKEGLLTDEVEAEVAAAVRQHADNAKAEIETLRATDADEAAIATIELDANLALQAQALAVPTTESDTASSTDSQTDLIAVAIDESILENAAEATTTLPALSKLIARVEQHTTRVRELQQTLDGQVSVEEFTDVARRIEDLERVAAEAFALPESESAAAQQLLVDVVARAQTLIVFMTELEVRETVAIDTVVPVVLTDGEKRAERQARYTTIDIYLQQIATTETDDTELLEKVAALQTELTAARAALETISDYDEFLAASDAALALGKDMLFTFEQSGLTILSPVELLTVGTTTDTGVAASTEEVVVEDTASSTAAETITEPTEPEPVATTTPEVDSDPILEPVVETTAATTPDQIDNESDDSATSTESVETENS